MRQTKVTLSVFHDGQFFNAVFEAYSQDGYRAAKQVFSAKPSDNELIEMICKEYYSLRFSNAQESEVKKELCKNPKRRQRQAAKAAKSTGFSTKAQEALRLQHEQRKKDAKEKSVINEKLKKEYKFKKKQIKKKEKHKGH